MATKARLTAEDLWKLGEADTRRELRLVWVIAPAAKSVTVYRADGFARLLREDDHLDGEDVLPGLLISLSELFE
jgi:Uma2 family endonuclease